MNIRFTEDIVPISDLRFNPGRIVKQARQVHRSVVLTSWGKGVAVVQSLKNYESE